VERLRPRAPRPKGAPHYDGDCRNGRWIHRSCMGKFAAFIENVQKPNMFQLQGALPHCLPDQGSLCPWTPPGALSFIDCHYRLVLFAVVSLGKYIAYAAYLWFSVVKDHLASEAPQASRVSDKSPALAKDGLANHHGWD